MLLFYLLFSVSFYLFIFFERSSDRSLSWMAAPLKHTKSVSKSFDWGKRNIISRKERTAKRGEGIGNPWLGWERLFKTAAVGRARSGDLSRRALRPCGNPSQGGDKSGRCSFSLSALWSSTNIRPIGEESSGRNGRPGRKRGKNSLFLCEGLFVVYFFTGRRTTCSDTCFSAESLEVVGLDIWKIASWELTIWWCS